MKTKEHCMACADTSKNTNKAGVFLCQTWTYLVVGNFTHVGPLGFVLIAFTAKDQQDFARPRHFDILQKSVEGPRGVGRVHQHLEVLLQVNVLCPARHHLCRLDSSYNGLHRQQQLLSGTHKSSKEVSMFVTSVCQGSCTACQAESPTTFQLLLIRHSCSSHSGTQT